MAGNAGDLGRHAGWREGRIDRGDHHQASLDAVPLRYRVRPQPEKFYRAGGALWRRTTSPGRRRRGDRRAALSPGRGSQAARLVALFQDICADLRVIAADGRRAVPEISFDERYNQFTQYPHRQGATSDRSSSSILVTGRRSAHGLSALAAQSLAPVRTASLPTLRPVCDPIVCDDEIPARKGRGRQYQVRFG